jgi:hypothetical protein
MSNLLLIDSNIREKDFLLSCLTPNTEYIVFNKDTIEQLIEKITKTYVNIGILQHNNTYNEQVSTYYVLEPSAPDYDIYQIPNKIQVFYDADQKIYKYIDGRIVDPQLEVYSNHQSIKKWKMVEIMDEMIIGNIEYNGNFLEFLKHVKTHTQYLDLLACNLWSDEDWKITINNLSDKYLPIRASSNNTGADGDFILESHNFSMIGVYFNEEILKYQYAFANEYTLTQVTSGTLPFCNENPIAVSNNGVLASVQWGANIYYSTNDGNTWNTATNGGNGWWAAISIDGRYIMATGNYASIYRNDNGTNAINSVRSFSSVSTLGNGYTCSMSYDGRYAVYVTNTGVIYYSSNYAASWSLLTSTGGTSVNVQISGDGKKIIYIRYDTNTLYLYNLEASGYSTFGQWTTYTLSSNSRRFCMNRDASIIYVSLSSGSILKIKNIFGTPATYSLSLGHTPYIIVCSGNGKIVCYTRQSTTLYVSLDEGATYSTYTTTAAITSVGMNTSGSRIYGCNGSGTIFIRLAYGTFSSPSVNVYNGSFTNPPVAANNFLYYNSNNIPNWSISSVNSNGNIITNTSTAWGYPTMPSGITQWYSTQFLTATGSTTLSQNIYFTSPGTYRLTYYTTYRPSITTPTNFTIESTISDVSSGMFMPTKGAWDTRIMDFTIPMGGEYPLYFYIRLNDATTGDRTVYLTGISITYMNDIIDNIPTYPIYQPYFANYKTLLSNQSTQNYGLALSTINSTRIAFLTSGTGLYYSRIINGVWGTLSTPTVSFNNAPSNTQYISCALTSNASRLIVSVGTFNTSNNYLYWSDASGVLAGTSTTLSFTQTLETTQRLYMSSSVTSDGSRLVVSTKSGYVYFAVWNGTNYNALTQILDSNLGNYYGVALSTNGSRLAYMRNKDVFWSVWNGTNYPSGTLITGTTNGVVGRSLSFMGSNTDLLISTYNSGQPQYTVWNGNNYGAWTNIPSSALQSSDGWGLVVDNSGSIFLAENGTPNIYFSSVNLTQPVHAVTFSNSITPITNQRIDNLGLALSAISDTRVAVFTTFVGVYYSRIINGNWGTYSAASSSFDVTPNGTNYMGCCMMLDATRLIVPIGSYNTANIWIYWCNATGLLNGTSNSLSFKRILDTNQRVYMMTALTGDGSRLVASTYSNGYVYFSNWNGTNYGILTPILDTNIRAYVGVALTSDGNILAYNADKTTYWSVWNGTNYSVGKTITGTANGLAARGLCFIGDRKDVLIQTNQDGLHQYSLWDGKQFGPLTNISSSSLVSANGWGLTSDVSSNIYMAPYNVANVYECYLSPIQTPLVATNAPVQYKSSMFTSDNITITDQQASYRNGNYITSASSVYQNNYSSAGAWLAFNQNTTSLSLGDYWHSGASTYSNGTYTGSVTTTNISGSANIKGEWIQIQLPYRLLPKRVSLMCRSQSSSYVPRLPSSMTIVGSNDGSNWNIVYSQTSRSYTYSNIGVNNIDISGADAAYSYLRLIAVSLDASGIANALNIQQVNYFGDIYLLRYPETPILNSITPGNKQLALDVTYYSYPSPQDVKYFLLNANSGSDVSSNMISPITLSGLVAGTTYSTTVRSANNLGISDYSITLSGVPYSEPSQPVITFYTTEPKSLIVGYITNDNGRNITSITYTLNNQSPISTNNVTNPLIIPTLTEGNVYSIVIQASNIGGSSIGSESFTFYLPITNSNNIPISIDFSNNMYTLTQYDASVNSFSYKYSNDGINWASPTISNLLTNQNVINWYGPGYSPPLNPSNRIYFKMVGQQFAANKVTTRDYVYDVNTATQNRSVLTINTNNVKIGGNLLLPHKTFS